MRTASAPRVRPPPQMCSVFCANWYDIREQPRAAACRRDIGRTDRFDAACLTPLVDYSPVAQVFPSTSCWPPSPDVAAKFCTFRLAVSLGRRACWPCTNDPDRDAPAKRPPVLGIARTRGGVAVIESVIQLRFITQFRPKGDASLTTSALPPPILRRMSNPCQPCESRCNSDSKTTARG